MNIIIGIDGGGTKTIGQLRFIDSQKTYTATSGSASLSQNYSLALTNLTQLIHQLLAGADCKTQPFALCVGLAGAGDKRLASKCQKDLEATFGNAIVAVMEDSETTVAGAQAHLVASKVAHNDNSNQAFTLLALGTGSFVAYINNKQKVHYLGGWGFPIGDEGSGAKLGYAAVQMFLTAFDQASLCESQLRNETSALNAPLFRALLKRIGRTKTAILSWLSTATQAEYAAFASEIFDLQAQCPVADELLKEHINQVKRLCNNTKSEQIIFTGGLAAPTYEYLLKRDNAFASRIQVMSQPSLEGAITLAHQLANDPGQVSNKLNAINDNAAYLKFSGELTPLQQLVSEQRNPLSMQLDELDSQAIARLMNQQDQGISHAIQEQIENIAHAIDSVKHSLEVGGRLIYVGAGTSGRLGVLDAVECPPTFSTRDEQIIGLIAGGESAMYKAVEGAEDSQSLAVEDLAKLALNHSDTLVGIAASGRTPYVIGAIEYAKQVGAKAISVCCNPTATINDLADIAIAVNVGPEVLTGSTRLKAGTAQKMILNMISTGALVQTGKCFENLMVDVHVSNDKLKKRAVRIIQSATLLNEQAAIELLEAANNKVKLAIFMSLSGKSPEQAEQVLKDNNDNLRLAIKALASSHQG